MSKKNKNTLKEIKELNGRELLQLNREPMVLEQIWGGTGLSKYSNLTEEQYSEKIQEMNRIELEAHAREIGILIPFENSRLKDELIKEYKNYINSLSVPNDVDKRNKSVPLNSNYAKEVESILKN